MTGGLRSLIKPLLYRFLSRNWYMRLQAASMSREIARGLHDEKEARLIPALALPGEAAVDIGSNYAMVSYHLSRAVGASGKVYAFEPIPFPYDVSRMIAERLGLSNVDFRRQGCGEANRFLSFRVPLQTGGAPSAGQSHMAGRNNELPGKDRHFRFQSWETVECEVVRLDDALPSDADISFIKADIEGAELLAFRGAERLIDRCRPAVLSEINRFFLQGFGIRIEQLLSFFYDKGYKVYRLDIQDGLTLVEIDAADIDETNVFFLHPDRLARLNGVRIVSKR